MSDARAERRYIPQPTGLNREFYRCTLAGGLHLQTCDACGQRQHPPRYFCGSCRSKSLTFKPASGKGVIYSFTVSHFTHDPGWVDEAPFATVIVETDEGPRIIASWTGDNDHVEIGVRVHVGIEPVNDVFGILRAEPEKATAG